MAHALVSRVLEKFHFDPRLRRSNWIKICIQKHNPSCESNFLLEMQEWMQGWTRISGGLQVWILRNSWGNPECLKSRVTREWISSDSWMDPEWLMSGSRVAHEWILSGNWVNSEWLVWVDAWVAPISIQSYIITRPMHNLKSNYCIQVRLKWKHPAIVHPICQ